MGPAPSLFAWQDGGRVPRGAPGDGRHARSLGKPRVPVRQSARAVMHVTVRQPACRYDAVCKSFVPRQRSSSEVRYAYHRYGDCRDGFARGGEPAPGVCGQRTRGASHRSLMASNDVQLPSDDQVVELADNSMRIFMTSVREKSMRGLWDHISLRFREKYLGRPARRGVQGLLRPADNRRPARREKSDLHGGSRRSTSTAT